MSQEMSMLFNRERFIKDIKNIIKPGVGIIVYIAIFDFLFHKVCPSRLLIGVPCPGCGITRAFLLVLHGKFAEATRMHPFWIVIVLGTIVALSERYFIKNDEVYNKLQKINQVILFILLFACLIFYIYRMINLYPNHAPMIYERDNLRNYTNTLIMNIFK